MARFSNRLLVLRFLGVLLLVLGAFIWWQGGVSIPVSYRDFAIQLPLQYALLFLGLIVLASPTLPLVTLAALLPGERGKPLLEFVRSAESQVFNVASSPDPESVAQYVKAFSEYVNRRYVLTVIVISIFFFLVLPFLVADLIARSNFARQSRRLVTLSQEARLSFSNADMYRQQLRDADDSLMAYKDTTSATREIFDTLSGLYSPTITTSRDFESALSTQYQAKVIQFTSRDYALVSKDGLKVPYASSLENPAAKATLLTIIGVICNEQGGQGQHINSYLQGRQFLQAAIAIAKEEGLKLPTTHNALGVNYASTLKCYSDYAAKFATPSYSAALEAALGEAEAIKPLALALLADKEYGIAAGASTSNFARSRFLNNKVDLRLELLRDIHLHNRPFEPASQSDEEFLRTSLAWPPSNGERVAAVLAGLLEDIQKSLDLAHEPQFYFTRAELLCLSGQLSEKYKLSDSRFRDISKLRMEALQDLRTSLSLGLSPIYLSEARSTEFGFDWLVADPTAKAAFTLLAQR